MTFMESPFVLRALEEIEFLQERIEEIGLIFVELGEDSEVTEDLKIEFLHALYALAEKEHNLYTRISLSDDVGAKNFKRHLIAKLMEVVPDAEYHCANDYFIETKFVIKQRIKEMTGEDMDDYEGIDIVFNWTDGSL